MSVGVSITAANAAAIETPTLMPLESVDCLSINSQSAVLELEQARTKTAPSKGLWHRRQQSTTVPMQRIISAVLCTA